jgi:DNA-directed RNA polymerase subunit N (RpoN/RPB10)
MPIVRLKSPATQSLISNSWSNKLHHLWHNHDNSNLMPTIGDRHYAAKRSFITHLSFIDPISSVIFLPHSLVLIRRPHYYHTPVCLAPAIRANHAFSVDLPDIVVLSLALVETGVAHQSADTNRSKHLTKQR